MTATIPPGAREIIDTIEQTEIVERNVHADLRTVIERTILDHPRSAQVAIGPSEIGVECDRKLAHKLAQTPPVRPEVASWRPTVGTAVHAWLAEAFDAENASLGWERYLVETKVWVGDIDGEMVWGSADLFDLLTGTVIDWKVPGVTTIKKARSAGSPGEQYRAQAHLYGAGFANLDLDVRHVAVYFLPAAGELGDGYYWTEPFDPAIATKALARATGLAAGIKAIGPDLLIPQLTTRSDHCSHCDWWQPGATDLARACPGVENAIRQSAPALTLTS